MKSTIKILLISTIFGAAAGAGAACYTTKYCNKSTIAVANVQEIVTASPKVQSLQAEQKAKIEGLALFVQNANEEISKEANNELKQELENKYVEELNAKKIEFETDYIQKLSEISNELSDTINAKAAEKGYGVVLSKDAVVAGAKDITDELIKAME